MIKDKPHSCCSPDKQAYRYLLVFSLALNIFFVGIAASHFFMMPAGSPMPMRFPNPDTVVDRISKDLSVEDAKKLKTIYEENKEKSLQNRTNLREAVQEVEAILKTDPFDAQKFDEATVRVREAGENLHKTMMQVMRRAALELSDEGRHRLTPWKRHYRGGQMGPFGPREPKPRNGEKPE